MIFLDLLQQSKVPRRGTGLKQRSEPLGAPKHHQQQQQQQTEQKFSMDQGQHNTQNKSHEGTTALTSSQHQPSTTNIHQHQPASINHYNSKSNHYNSNPTHESRKKHLLMKLTQFYFISLCLAGSTQQQSINSKFYVERVSVRNNIDGTLYTHALCLDSCRTSKLSDSSSNHQLSDSTLTLLGTIRCKTRLVDNNQVVTLTR